ncbi:MAG: acetyl-CoA decarbonylase/synthase complex subunit gamma, partial [Candidatus Omnitrophica bacterium]|nr:acetyl-CoA decarbonylase/synthase complex subunit gamma [Candidatus Omnitrophota bacterium]
MALSGLDIYKLLPKTNCRECGLATCLAFAMQIAKKAVPIDKCPYVSADSKQILEASSLPPIKLITIGETDRKLTIGNETVMFRHEEKFHHPCGIGFIIEDSESDAQIKEKLQRIAGLQFERIGQTLQPDLVAITHCKEKARFLEVVRMVNQCCALPLVLITSQTDALQEALTLIKGKRPLVYSAGTNNLKEFAQLAKEYSATLVITASDLEGLSTLTKEAASLGITDLMLDTGKKPLAQKIWDFTQIRKQAIKKSNRSLGYPTIAIIERDDPLEEAYEAATFITKYAGIVLLKSIDTAQVLPLLTLRQNIYTDPQKPLQIEPKLYPIGQVTDSSPVLVTTNFSLSYY